MTPERTAAILTSLKRIAREAAVVVMDVYRTDFAVEMKGKDDPVTRADKEANALICARLSAAFPDAGVLAEESVPKTDEERVAIASKQHVFFVDPVDGTREFADKNGEFCVMIGLAVDGHAHAGVVAVPVENKLFFGSVHGTCVEALDGSSEPAELTVLVPEATEGAVVRAVVSRSHPSARTRAILEHAGVTETLPCGSVGLKAARIVEGRAHVYVHPSRGASLWDACAPEALVRGAGGAMTRLDGAPIDYRGELPIRDGLIATSSALLPRVVAAIERAARESASA